MDVHCNAIRPRGHHSHARLSAQWPTLADATAVGPDIVSAPVQTSSPLVQATPIVFVVDDDVGMRESLVSLISGSGWRPETFASAQDRALGLASPSSIPDADCRT